MLLHVPAADRWLRHLAFGIALSIALAGSPSLAAAAADQPVVRVVDCNPSSLKSTFQTNVVQSSNSSGEEDDNASEDSSDSGDDPAASDLGVPPIFGSIAVGGVQSTDSKAIAAALSAKGMTTITPDAATAAAQDALTDAGLRTFKKPALQTDNEQVIWSVQTSVKIGVNPSLEVKVEAGNGNILSIDCD